MGVSRNWGVSGWDGKYIPTRYNSIAENTCGIEYIIYFYQTQHFPSLAYVNAHPPLSNSTNDPLGGWRWAAW